MEENQEEKNLGWRPNKLKNFIEAFKLILSEDEWQVIYLTDDELRIVCNSKLEEKAQISDATFENRKAWKLKDSPEYQEFLGLYKKGLINQKTQLFNTLRYDPNQWQRIAWIIERKFSDWNLKQISEVDQNLNWNLNISNILWEIQWMNKSN